MWLRGCAPGRTAHGSMPALGDNAVNMIARAAQAVEAFCIGDAPHALMGARTVNIGTVAGGANGILRRLVRQLQCPRGIAAQ